MSPEYVRPYVKAQKNDGRDAEAIAEAATRPTVRFVPVKSDAQSDLQSLRRAWEGLVARKLEKELSNILADETQGLSSRIRQLIGDLRAEWEALDKRIKAF